MAITKILPVRGQLKGCLDYAANPQKTAEVRPSVWRRKASKERCCNHFGE